MGSNSVQVIKNSSEFLTLKQVGKRYSPTKWLLLNYQKNDLVCVRFGVTASRKVGSAVIRNKLKRWVREFFRSEIVADCLLEADINIIFKPMDMHFYKGLHHEEFKKAMEKGVEIVRKNT